MAEIEILPQKIVDTRIVILKSRLDSNMAKLQGEQLKTGFFVRFGFLKPKPKDVLLVAFSKYYDPYILIGGKYSIYYCKRHNYALKVEDRTQAMYIDGKKMKPEPLSLGQNARVIKLVGEEHSHYENATYVVLDRLLQEVPPERLFFAPFESELENGEVECFDLRKPHITLGEEIAVIRSRVARRPSDVAEIIREIFEITERAIIYSPVYELTYKNLKNGKNVTALINGITGEVMLGKFSSKTSRKLGSFEASVSLPAIQSQFLRAAPEPPQQPRHMEISGDAYASNSAPSVPAERLVVGDRVSAAAPAMQPAAAGGFRSNAENTTQLATDFMARLGYRQGQFPTKLYADGETNVVELQLQQGTARVQIDPRTKEVKAYEIQEAEEQEGFFTSKRKLLLSMSSIVAAIAVILKLINVF
jgi:hypothetical protein